jgi:hypothetical protein
MTQRGHSGGGWYDTFVVAVWEGIDYLASDAPKDATDFAGRAEWIEGYVGAWTEVLQVRESALGSVARAVMARDLEACAKKYGWPSTAASADVAEVREEDLRCAVTCLCRVVCARALELRDLCRAASQGPGRQHLAGAVFAWGRVISLLQNQAEICEIPLDELGLDTLNPDTDLWCGE